MAFKFDLFILNPSWNFNKSVALGIQSCFILFIFRYKNYPKQKSSLLLWQIQYRAITKMQLQKKNNDHSSYMHVHV